MARKKKNDINPIWATTITTIGVIIVALFAFPPFQRLFEPKASPTAISTDTPVPTSTFTLQPDTPAPSLTFTETYTPTFTPTETLTPIPPTLTLTLAPGLPIGMQVKVTANPPSGKKPLKVTIDARDSFVRAPNGDIFQCRNGACSYTWYLTNPGGQSVQQTEKGGYINFTFDKKGTYYINVYICHGADNPTCASSGISVKVD